MLATRTAILTRPAGRNQALAQRLREAGWEVLVLPALAITPLQARPGTFPHPHDYDLVVFVSGNAARLYLDDLARLFPGTPWPPGTQAAAVGPATAAALRELPGFGADTTVLHPPAGSTSDSESLWRLLQARSLPQRVLLVRGTQGRDWLADKLTEAGAQVTRHAQYLRSAASWPDDVRARLRNWAVQGQPAWWLLTSGEGIQATAAHIHEEGLNAWWSGCGFVLTHPRLRATLRQALGGEDRAAVVKDSMPADEAIFEAFVAA